MIYWTLSLIVLAILAGMVGFAFWIGKVILFLLLIGFVAALIFGARAAV